MRTRILLAFVIACISMPIFANSVTTCQSDKYTQNRISELSSKRDMSLIMTNTSGEEVGALFLSKNYKPVDMLICGTFTNYFYIRGSLNSWIPTSHEYKQIATVDSATIYQDEAVISAISYTDDEMQTEDNYSKIKINFQTFNLADLTVESGEFYISIPN